MRSSLSYPGETAPSQGDERHRLVLALRGKLDRAPGTRTWERFCAEGPVQVFYFFKPQCSHHKRGKCKVVAGNKRSNKRGARGTFPEPQEELHQWSLLLFHSLDSVTREWIVSQLDVKHLWNRRCYRLLPYSLHRTWVYQGKIPSRWLFSPNIVVSTPCHLLFYPRIILQPFLRCFPSGQNFEVDHFKRSVRKAQGALSQRG